MSGDNQDAQEEGRVVNPHAHVRNQQPNFPVPATGAEEERWLSLRWARCPQAPVHNATDAPLGLGGGGASQGHGPSGCAPLPCDLGAVCQTQGQQQSPERGLDQHPQALQEEQWQQELLPLGEGSGPDLGGVPADPQEEADQRAVQDFEGEHSLVLHPAVGVADAGRACCERSMLDLGQDYSGSL